MKTLGNVLWLVLGGLWLALGYLFAALLMALLVITIPFAIAALRMAAYVIWPFGRTVVSDPRAGAPSLVGNVLWFLLAGWWIAIGHVVAGIVMCLTIIGIPFGLVSFRLAVLALAPLGQQVVSKPA